MRQAAIHIPDDHSNPLARTPGRRPGTRRLSALVLALGLAALAAGCSKSKGGSEDPIGGGTGDPGGGGGGGGPISAPSNLSYGNGSVFAVLDESIDPITPTLDGAATSYSVSPALPGGITLDPSTGVLSGVPSQRSSRKAYQFTAANTQGQTTAVVDIEVVGHPRFAYVSNSGDSTLSIYAAEAGSGRLHFHGYHAHGTGELGPGPLAVHPEGLATYVANTLSNSLSAHRIDPATGRVLATVVHALAAGPHSLALLPSGSFLYIGAQSASSITGFSVDPTSGALTPIGAPLALGSAPSQILADPMGRYLVVLQQAAGQISTFRIHPATGALTPAGTWPIAAAQMAGAALAPSGRALYLTLPATDQIVHFAVDPATATLTQGASLPTTGDPTPPTIDPTGKHVYVGDATATSLQRYLVNPSTGALTPQGSTTASTGASRISFDTSGKYAYSVHTPGNSLSVFRRNAQTGELTEIERRRTRQVPSVLGFASGDEVLAVRAEHLHVTNRGSNNIFSFVLNAQSGALTPLAPAPSAGGPSDLALDPLRRWAFTANGASGEVRSYRIQPDGSLVAYGSPILQGGEPRALTVDPSGRWLYVTDLATAQLHVYEIAAGENPPVVLSPLTPRPVATLPVDVEVDPTGQFLYVVSGAQTTVLKRFGIDPRTGNLTALPDLDVIAHPTCITFSPEGHRAYMTLSTGDFFAPFDLDPFTGALQFVVPGTRFPDLPVDIKISSSGRFAYAAMNNPTQPTGGVAVFDVRQADGALWNAQTGNLQPKDMTPTGNRPVALGETPDDRFLFVLNEGSQTLAALSVQATTGQLAFLQNTFTGTSPSSLTLDVRAR